MRLNSGSLLQLADLAMDTGDPSHARSLYEQHLRIAERRADALPGSTMAQADLAVALERLGDLAAADAMSVMVIVTCGSSCLALLAQIFTSLPCLIRV